MTMYGKIFLPEKMDKYEDRFNNRYFDRTVYFMEDLNSDDAITFCNRYLHLPSYEEMYDDIVNYYTNIKNPVGWLYKYDKKTGKEIMCRTVLPNQPRQMCISVDPGRGKRNMCTISDRRPDINEFINK